MDNQTAVDYIRQCVAAGMTEPAIREQLGRSGWPPEAINQAFMQYNYGGSLPQPQVTSGGAYAAAPSGGGFKFKLILVALLAVILVGIAGYTLLSKNNKTNQNTNTGTGSQQSTQTPQAKDVQAIADGVTSYVSKNSGVQPATVQPAGSKVLKLCGLGCGSGAVSVTLNTYQAKNISLQAYKAGLKVPDSSLVYLVAAASCKGNGSGIGTTTSGTQASMAFLYATSSGSSLTQHCTTL